MTMTEAKKKPHPLTTLAGLAGAGVGFAFSRYGGASAWIPSLAVVLLLVLFSKTPIRPKWFTGAIAVTGAHVMWFVAGAAISGMWAAVFLDIIVMSLGIVSLWLRPSVASAVFLGGVQLISLVVNVIMLFGVEAGSAPHRALTVHCVFRVISIMCIVRGSVNMRKGLITPKQNSEIETQVSHD